MNRVLISPSVPSQRRTLPRSVVLVLVVGMLVLSACTPATGSAVGNAGESAAGATGQAATQRQEGGQVNVVATWDGREAGPVFRVALDTHSVDLDAIDLAEGAVLRTAAGEVTATEWTSPKGGHHRSGELVFPATTAGGRPTLGEEAVELLIRNVAGVPERSFRWQS